MNNLEEAQRKIIEELAILGFKLKDVIQINKGRYSILTSPKKKILLTFKRDPFFNFGKMFLGKEDLGDTINEEELELAMRVQVTDIITVFSNGISYTIPFWKFMEKSFKWKCEEGKEVRSISMKEYTKIFVLE